MECQGWNLRHNSCDGRSRTLFSIISYVECHCEQWTDHVNLDLRWVVEEEVARTAGY